MPAWYPGTHLGFIELFSFFIVFYVLNRGIPYLMSSFLSSHKFSLSSCPLLSTLLQSDRIPVLQVPLPALVATLPWLLLWRSKLSRYSGQGFHRGTQRRTFLTFSLQDYSRAPFNLCSNKCFPTGPPGTLVMFDSNLWPFLCTDHYNLVSPGTNKICSLGYHCPCWELLLWRMVRRISSSLVLLFIFWNIGWIQSTLFPLAPSITIS